MMIRLLNKKKIFISSLFLSIIFILFLFPCQLVNANDLVGLEPVAEEIRLGTTDLRVTITRIINVLMGILGVIALAIVLYGGFIYMTAQGVPEKIDKAKKILIAGVIGLVITLSAFAISSFILRFLVDATGGTGPGDGYIIGNGDVPGGSDQYCPDPDPLDSRPWLCIAKKDLSGQIGKGLTLYGGLVGNEPGTIYFTDKDQNERYEAEILKCQPNDPDWFKDMPGSSLKSIKVKVPNLPLGLDGNKYYVVAELPDGTSRTINKNWPGYVGDDRLDRFTLESVSVYDGPILICFLDEQDRQIFDSRSGSNIKIKGQQFGGNSGSVIFNSDKTNDAAVISSWQADLINLTVPQTESGDVEVVRVDGRSDQEYLAILCDTHNDCGSGCCQEWRRRKICLASEQCLGGAGSACNDGASCTSAAFSCAADLYCDPADCTCKRRGLGANCSSTPLSCTIDQTLCGDEFYCASDCTCQYLPVIEAVQPGNGAAGNFITIWGRGFGGTEKGENLLQNGTFENSAVGSLPAGWTRTIEANTNVEVTRSQAHSGRQSVLLYREPNVTSGNWATLTYDLSDIDFGEINSKYLLKFKYKGNNGQPLRIAISYDIGWTGQVWNKSSDPTCVQNGGAYCADSPGLCVCSDYVNYCCANAPYQTKSYIFKNFQAIPASDYGDWQSYEGLFSYTEAIAQIKDNTGKQRLLLQFNLNRISNITGTNFYLDDIELIPLPKLGQVYFCGNQCDDGDDILAPFPFENSSYCSLESSWQDNQVIIAVPQGATTGPIKLVNLDGQADTTSNISGWQGDFVVNEIKRPALCGVIPSSGEFNSTVRARGLNFGQVKDSVLLGGVEFYNKLNWFWGILGQGIGGLVVPNLQPGVLPVQVKVGDELSNPFNFRVLPSTQAPSISYITPTFGPNGQYITIFGSNFGNTPGLVEFLRVDNLYVPADTASWPVECRDGYWQDNQIVVKAPYLGNIENSKIVVTTSTGAKTNEIDFRYCYQITESCPLSPGICAVIPDQGPAGTQINIYGDNFTTYNLSYSTEAIFWQNQRVRPAGSSDWTQTKIKVTVPMTAETGPLKVVNRFGNVSNEVLYTVADCRADSSICNTAITGEICCPRDGVCQTETSCYGETALQCTYGWAFTTGKRPAIYEPPQVIEDIQCLDDIQSPSPWKDSDNNCKNAVIAARFNKAINPATLTINNIVVRKCNSGSNFDAAACGGEGITNGELQIFPAETPTGFIYDFDKEIDTWYEVTLVSGSTGIRSTENEGGLWLDGDFDKRPGGNYKWHFKVRNIADDCQLEKVVVKPQEAKIEQITATQEYAAFALAANCNILPGNSYDWDWYKVYSDGTEEDDPLTPAQLAACPRYKCIANISENDVNGDGNRDWRQMATPLKQGRVFVGARTVNQKDDNNNLVINLNIPEIYRIYPDNGLIDPDVNSYVTIYGNNFGEKKNASRVLFGNVEAQIAPDCPSSWTNNQIQVIAPKPMPVPASFDPTYSSPNLTRKDGMVIFYDFEDNSNVILEDKAGNNDGEIFGAQRVSDSYGKALAFNGIDNYVKLPNNYNFNFDTLELWFKPADFQANVAQTLFSISDGSANNLLAFEILPLDANNARLQFSSGTSVTNVSGTIITKNKWHHLVFSQGAFYINGFKFHNPSWSIGNTINFSALGFLPNNVLLGAKNTGDFSGHYNGRIDGFAVYNRGLSIENVWNNYVLRQGQILLLNFEDIGADITDSSANRFTDLQLLDASTLSRPAGKYGQAIAGTRIKVNDNPSLVFDKEFTVEGWFRVADKNREFTLFSANGISIGNLNCGGAHFCFSLSINNTNEQNDSLYTYLSRDRIINNEWNYFAAVYDGREISLYLNSHKNSYPALGRIYQTADYNNAYINGSSSAMPYAALDNFAVYNRALTESEISSRLGAMNGVPVIVQTNLGRSSSAEPPLNQYFYHSDLVYPFLCALSPQSGKKGTQISVIGENFGDSNRTLYQGQNYDLGSIVNFDMLKFIGTGVRLWSNKLTQIINPFDDYGTPEIPVSISIDPFTEPFQDKDFSGDYTPGEPFVDLNRPGYVSGQYDSASYLVEKFDPENIGQTGIIEVLDNLQSNSLPFYLSPVITSVSPDNGPINTWVTISGYNFGSEPGEVYFYDADNPAAFPPEPCKNYWTNRQIIVVVPEDAKAGDLYLVTAQGLESNKVRFTVNNKPLGPGLCQITPDIGAPRSVVTLQGDRFDEENDGQGADNVIFNKNKIVSSPDISSWTNHNIMAKVPTGTEDGPVVVTKRREIGRACAGFSIGSWCPGGQYNIITEDIPSNPLYFDVFLGCELAQTSQIRTDISLEPGFPIRPFYPAGDSRSNLKVDVAQIATDGTYLYTRSFYRVTLGGNQSGVSGYDIIYKIGSGYNGTELGRIYKEYVYDNRLADENNLSYSITYHSDGNFYSGRIVKIDNKYHIYKIIFNDSNNTYGLELVPIGSKMSPYWCSDWDEENMGGGVITSNGKYIFNISPVLSASNCDPGGDSWKTPIGYRIRVFEPQKNWLLVKDFTVRNNENYTASVMYGAVADDNIIYPINWSDFSGNIQMAIDWRAGNWADDWTIPSTIAHRVEVGGQYDWQHNIFWIGQWAWLADSDLAINPKNNIFRYPSCPLTGEGVCVVNEDCNKCGQGTSQCVNGRCTPYIVSFTPNSGPIGTWVDIAGCYFGCDAGTVLFTDNKPALFLNDPECGSPWQCDKTGTALDEIQVEVPNIKTTTTADDAVTGPITVVTAYGLSHQTTSNFTVNNNPIGQQICSLTPSYGNRGITLRIHGENFGQNSSGDYVYFGLGDGLNASEPWFDSNNDGSFTPGEPFIDINNNQQYDSSLNNDPYSFEITDFVSDANKCPASGWSDKDICFKVPAGAAGQGNQYNQAINNVKVYKAGNDNNQRKQFTLTFGNCGNQVINSGEQCDGIALPEGITCTSLGWPNNDACTIQCQSNCKLLVCDKLTNDCYSIEDLLCGNSVIDSYPGYTEQCDGDNLAGQTCSGLGLDAGNLACSSSCLFDTSGCSGTDDDDTDVDFGPGPKVEAITPQHGEQAFCRNGLIDIYFDSLIDSQTATKENILLQACSSGQSITGESRNIASRILHGVINVFSKLIGRDNKIQAALNCDSYINVTDYSLQLTNNYNRALVSIRPDGLLSPEKIYRVRISSNIKNIPGANFDNTGTPIPDANDYIFDFSTLGQSSDPQSGICNVEWINIRVYRQPYTGINPPLEDRKSELRVDDLFICAGRNDCRLSVDYDQDTSKAGNQHIYEAIAKYSNGFSLKANYQWSKIEQFDPSQAITIYNDSDDTDPSANKVKNSSGIVYATAAPIKEAVAKLVVEAQAEGSTVAPVQQEFITYVLLCENPWPSIAEKFPISSIINAYNFQLYYCRDAGRPGDTSDDLPAARWLFPEVASLNILENTDFELGKRSPWVNAEDVAFVPQPVYRDITLFRDGISSQIQGNWWISSRENYQGYSWQDINSNGLGESALGIMNSQAFLIEGDQLKFLVGGSQNNWPANVSEIVDLEDSSIAGVTAVVLAVKDNPASTVWQVVASATGENRTTMREVTINTSPYMTGRFCQADADCNGYGKCDCQGGCSPQNSGTCSAVTGIIYIYDNNTGGYINFDWLRQFRSGVQIPIRF